MTPEELRFEALCLAVEAHSSKPSPSKPLRTAVVETAKAFEAFLLGEHHTDHIAAPEGGAE